jgi:predicted Na+-dependent transporter
MPLKFSLEWLGRQGTKVAAASILIGLAIPPLATALRPGFTPAIFLLLVFAFLRVDPAELRARFASPRLVAIASTGIMLALPVLFGLALPYTGISTLGPGVALGLMMYMAAPPIMASTAFAALLKLDTALTLALLIVCMAATPLLAPLVVSHFAGEALSIDAAQLALRLLAIVGAAMIAAQLLRYLLGNEKIAANKSTIDGINALLLLFFGITSMDGVTARAMREPLLVLALTGIALAVAAGTYLLTALIFWREGLKRSLALGFSAAHRNMGVMIAAAGSGLPELTWIYFAVAQFPIFLLPMLSAPVVHRLLEKRLPGGK